jgi:hypothetical protein
MRISVEILKRIEQALYSTSVVFLLIEILGVSISKLDIDLWLFSTSGEIKNPELLSVVLLVVCFVSFVIIFVSRLPELSSRYIKIVSEDSTLLRKAMEEVRDKTGENHSVSRVSITGLLNPSANLGVWMTSKGVWSAPIVFTINPITYIWLELVSLVKAFIIKGGFFQQLFPTVFGVTPVLVYFLKYGQNAI